MAAASITLSLLTKVGQIFAVAFEPVSREERY